MKKRWRVYFDTFEGPVAQINWAYIEADDYEGARTEVKRILDAWPGATIQLNKIVPENEPSFELWVKELSERAQTQESRLAE